MPSISLPVAVIGAGALGAAGSAIAGSEQAGAADKATALQQQIFATTQKNLAPFVGAGQTTENNLLALLGLGPQGGAGEEAALAATPGYKFALDQGLGAIMNRQSAVGGTGGGPLGLGGGNTLKALMKYGTGLADQTYQEAIANAFSAASLSENAAAGQGQIGANTGANIGDTLTQAGNARAAGTVGAFNSIGNIGQNFLLAQALGLGGGGGGFTGGQDFVGPGQTFSSVADLNAALGLGG